VKEYQMIEKFKAQLAVPVLVGISFALIALPTGCSTGMGANENLTTGNQELRSGISTARAGMNQYQAGDTGGGLSAIRQGRNMMGQGMLMMGLGCCLFDGGVADGGCVSSMGPEAALTLQGMAKFDAARSMMASLDAGTVAQAMADMEAGMEMMEQGASQMMGGRGSMGSMMN
jgi:hypothetical protein